ncbi:MAG: UDPGP type 1 family protein [Verrucomicrobia bacterium]|nr:UDPGP type 1 family protein [Verrucomicrobiota bacterium]
MTSPDLLVVLEPHNQTHLLRFWNQLDASGQDRLRKQIEGLDFHAVQRMQAQLRQHTSGVTKGDIAPPAVQVLAGDERARAVDAGEGLIAAGRVGVILVAGGQGTRLGFEGPKGAYPVAPITDATLFEIHARKILGLEMHYRCEIPFYIMTSDTNDQATRDFFAEHRNFGLDADRVFFFQQGMWPALDAEGNIILDRPDHIFMSPDGHGGTLSALRETGMLDDMAARGLECLFYFQVDNPLVDIADPAFVGAHAEAGADISVKLCAKRDPEEGLGMVVERDGGYAMVEYTELSHEQKYATQPDGELRFKYGSVAIHVFSREFLVAQSEVDLPLHVAHKQVPVCDPVGRTVTPDAPNAYKFEKFIFDVIPNAKRVLNLAFDREDEFSPIKNATGADSPATAQRDIMRKAARWLQHCKIPVPIDDNGVPKVRIEIDPAFAVAPSALKDKLPADLNVSQDVWLKHG